ncbi:DUF2235 domain-containing protein [Zobellia galactanivorans]|uniref:T6SS phospholipase effector Tle1-like catalytic domain-containing protein n=1 Tax=Zobellia galactanivorans (strain DSM 12802 / CCUG 47099 / CIP 106680 / NCIMB 13871 / Dsij) TaxID=63186 RepID=UPI0026E3422B|nr:DUF2235 domain-containing protein [Zobellia galactanivorans]MDO6811016.1 DUF2235 domain-containing protein [Zobellia galactanivorans]
MSQIGLSSQSVGAEEVKNVLNGIEVQTAPVHVGDSDYEEMIEDDAINITIGVFFDGTGNNRKNTEARKLYEERENGKQLGEDKNEIADKYLKLDLLSSGLDIIKNKGLYKKRTGSYENDLSNVARLEQFYEDTDKGKNYFEKVYIEGIGTTDYEDDDIPGMATGMSALWKFYNTGIRDKVKKGCERCAELISDKGTKNINHLTIDVFGFSRGAAAARNFLYEIHKKKGDFKEVVASPGTTSMITYTTETYEADGGLLGERLVKNNIRVKNATIRFAGLFDSVASHGLIQSNDVKDLGLDAVKHAQHTFHLVAADEHRFKFSLTDISSAIARGKGVEKYLPGVHSDVGGCYEHNKPEKNILLNFATSISSSQKRFQKDYRYLIEQGWYTKEQLTIQEEILDLTTMLGINDDSFKMLYGNREKISNKYSYIPLHFMGKQLFDKKVFKEDNLTQLKKKFKFSDDPVLAMAEIRLREYVFEGGKPLDFYGNALDRQILLSLRNKYFHFSSQYFHNLKSIGMQPEWLGDMRAREVYSDSGKKPKKVPLQYFHRTKDKERFPETEIDAIQAVPKVQIPKIVRINQ